MFDSPKNPTINRLLEVPDSMPMLLNDEIYAEAVKLKDDEFQDYELIWEIRRNILADKEEKKDEERTGETKKKKKSKRRIKPGRWGFFRLLLKIFFGYKEFVQPVISLAEEEEIEEGESFQKGEIKQAELPGREFEKIRLPEKTDKQEKREEKKSEINPFTRFTNRINIEKRLAKLTKKYAVSRYVIVIDIGTHSVKYIFAKKEKEFLVVEKYRIEKIPVFENEEDRNKKISFIIRKIAGEAELGIAEVIVVLSEIPTKTRIVQMPKLNKEEAHDAIMWKIKKELSEDTEESVIRYQILDSVEEKDINKVNVLAIIAGKEKIDRKVNLLNSIGIYPTKITFSSLAVFSYFKYFHPEEADEGSVIVDIGGYKSCLLIVERGILKMARDVNTGGEDFTKALEGEISIDDKTYSIDSDNAQKLKFDYGISSSNSVGKTFTGMPIYEVGKRLEPVSEKLFHEIKTSIDFFRKNNPDSHIRHFYLTGGGSHLINLGHIISKPLGLQAKKFNLIPNLKLSDSIIDGDLFYRDSFLLTNSFGLIPENLETFNFLGTGYKENRSIKLFNLIAAGAGILLLVVLVLMSLTCLSIKGNVEEELREVRARFNKFSPLREQYQVLLNQKDTFKSAQQEIEGELISLKGKFSPEEILKIVSNRVPKDITLISLDYEGNFITGEERKLIIEGRYSGAERTGDNRIISFALSLENSGYFKNVKMEKETTETDSVNGHFKIICTL